jgi:hypothetical protein
MANKMNSREYTITTGSYEDYHIVGRVSGPERPALSSLWKLFVEQFGIFSQPEPKWNDPAWHVWLDAKIHANSEAEERMRLGGYEGTIAEAFIVWIIEQHGFVNLKSDEFYVSA